MENRSLLLLPEHLKASAASDTQSQLKCIISDLFALPDRITRLEYIKSDTFANSLSTDAKTFRTLILLREKQHIDFMTVVLSH